MATTTSKRIEAHEWAKFHLKVRLDEADYDYDDGLWHGHGDRLVMEYFDKATDKHPVERLYFEFEYNYSGTVDATDAVKELLDSVEWDLDAAEGKEKR